jgi:hypothetical protein
VGDEGGTRLRDQRERVGGPLFHRLVGFKNLGGFVRRDFFYTASLVVSTRARVIDGLVRDRYAQQSEDAHSTHTCQIVKTSGHEKAACMSTDPSVVQLVPWKHVQLVAAWQDLIDSEPWCEISTLLTWRAKLSNSRCPTLNSAESVLGMGKTAWGVALAEISISTFYR